MIKAEAGNVEAMRGRARLAILAAVAALGLAGSQCLSGGAARADDDWLAGKFSPIAAAASAGWSEASAADAAQRGGIEGGPQYGYPTLAPDNMAAMKAAIKRYADIVARGGWDPIPTGESEQAMSGSGVARLRKRLESTGELRAGGGGAFDGSLQRALQRYQASNGLPATGALDKRTIAALNVPASARLRQLRTNLTRLTELSGSATRKYVLVNIPAAQIEAVENQKVISRHAGVVGKMDRQTPILRSSITQLNFNPVWTLPPTVIEKDLVPRGQDMRRRGQNVLTKFGIEAFDGNGRKLDVTRIDWTGSQARNLTYRQQPGPENPLGFVKINFDNNFSTYMHDTPSQSLFNKNFRAASSGCVRVQNIDQLAAWLLADNGDWTRARVLAMKKSGERKDVTLKKPVTLFFAYITAWANEDGTVQFRRDVYQRDGVGLTASAY